MSKKKTTHPVQLTSLNTKVKTVTRITTSEMANLLGCKPHTAIRSYCVNGHYLGLVPIKLPNGRLMWPYEDTMNILNN